MKARVGLSNEFAHCALKLIHETQFDSGGVLTMPIVFENDPPVHPVNMDNVSKCADKIFETTDATISFASDDSGKIGDLRVDPWHGDQEALACVAEALGAETYPGNRHFTASVRLYP